MKIKAKQIIVDGASYKYYKPKFCCKALEENPRMITFLMNILITTYVELVKL